MVDRRSSWWSPLVVVAWIEWLGRLGKSEVAAPTGGVPSLCAPPCAMVLCCASPLIGCGSGSVPTSRAQDTSIEIASSTAAGSSLPAAGQSSLAGPRKDAEVSNLRQCTLKHWVHSYEEDAQNVKVYRPAGYDFLPSRGGVGLEFREVGEVSPPRDRPRRRLRRVPRALIHRGKDGPASRRTTSGYNPSLWRCCTVMTRRTSEALGRRKLPGSDRHLESDVALAPSPQPRNV